MVSRRCRAAAEWRGSFAHPRTSGFGRHRLGGVAVLTRRGREPEHEAGQDEDGDRRHHGHQHDEQDHSITCAIPHAPVGARNAHGAMRAARTTMRRRVNRSLSSGVVERTLRALHGSLRGGSEHKSSSRGRDRKGPDRVTSFGGHRGHAGRVNVGIKLRLQDSNGGDLGIAHAPPPVELGDVLALADGSIWRVVNLIDLDALRRPGQHHPPDRHALHGRAHLAPAPRPPRGCYEKSGMRFRCAASSSIVSSEGRDS